MTQGSPHTGAYAADVEYDPALNFQDEVLLTPELPAMTLATLEFWSFGSIYWGGGVPFYMLTGDTISGINLIL